MGVLDKFLDIMKLSDDEDYDDDFYDDEYDDDFEEKPKKSFFKKIIREKILMMKKQKRTLIFRKNLQNRFIQAIKLLRCVSLQEEAMLIWKFVLSNQIP